jgi:hypothetical protein
MKTSTIVCELQPTIPAPPMPMKQMYAAACSADERTIDVWHDTWLANIRANKARFGSFADHAIGQEFGKFAGKPVIIAGAGPSLKENAHLLKYRPPEFGLVSCLHNFHFLIDAEAKVDYWVTLDAGPITIEEVTEGGDPKKDYWAATEGQTLIAYIGTHPDLIDKWRGKILFYNAPVPSLAFRDKVFEIEQFMTWISNGGNVLGACMYFAKGYLGSQVSIFVGADFCFSNKTHAKFHPWDSKYDGNLGQVLRACDIYGNSVATWASYWNFKLWFDYVVYTLPGIYINATEGGCFGAYREGNIEKLLQMDLAKVFETFSIQEKLRYQAENPAVYGPGSDVILI